MDLPHCLAARWRPFNLTLADANWKYSPETSHSASLPNVHQKRPLDERCPILSLWNTCICYAHRLLTCTVIIVCCLISTNLSPLMAHLWPRGCQGLFKWNKYEKAKKNLEIIFVIILLLWKVLQLLLYYIFCVFQDRGEVTWVMWHLLVFLAFKCKCCYLWFSLNKHILVQILLFFPVEIFCMENLIITAHPTVYFAEHTPYTLQFYTRSCAYT